MVRENDDCHPNAIGHSIIAQALIIEFEKNKFIYLRTIWRYSG